MQKALAAMAGLLLALPATAMAQHDQHPMHEDIAAVTASLDEAFDSGDAAAAAALYTDDAMLFPPNMEPVSGSSAIQAFWAETIAAGMTVDLKTKEVSGAGDMLLEVGGYSITAPDGSHADHGTFMVLYKNVDGDWKLHRDIWNSSMAMR